VHGIDDLDAIAAADHGEVDREDPDERRRVETAALTDRLRVCDRPSGR